MHTMAVGVPLSISAQSQRLAESQFSVANRASSSGGYKAELLARTLYLFKFSFQFSFSFFLFLLNEAAPRQNVNTLHGNKCGNKCGINVQFDGTPTRFPLYICAKCEHTVQWVMMCTHTGCSQLWLVCFDFHRLRAAAAFAQVSFSL